MTTLPVPFAPSAEAALPRQGAGRAQPPAPESAAPQSAAPGLSGAESTEVADVEQLRVTFRRGGRDVHALRGISLRIRAREILGLVWESGSGKSVLGLSLLGLLRAKVQALEALRAREGQIAVLDTNVLMHYQRLDEIPWAAVLGVTPVRIILPSWTTRSTQGRTG